MGQRSRRAGGGRTQLARPPRIVVINGPIASGKSTVALELARLVEREGGRAANIDLDDLWLMLHHRVRPSEVRHWLLARRAAALLTDEFLANGIDTVIVDGPFFTPEERSGFVDHLRAAGPVPFVTLWVSLEESVRRVRSDPGLRESSRDAAFLAERYARCATLRAALLPDELVVDTDGRAPAELAASIAARLDQGGAR